MAEGPEGAAGRGARAVELSGCRSPGPQGGRGPGWGSRRQPPCAAGQEGSAPTLPLLPFPSPLFRVSQRGFSAGGCEELRGAAVGRGRWWSRAGAGVARCAAWWVASPVPPRCFLENEGGSIFLVASRESLKIKL